MGFLNEKHHQNSDESGSGIVASCQMSLQPNSGPVAPQMMIVSSAT
jgi:hypothetical protein